MMKITRVAAVMFLFSCVVSGYVEGQKQLITNPIINGYFADPSIVKYQDTYYIYATIDPWGSNELAVLTTKDFRHWEQKHINWPTKTACTSNTSGSDMVWAPSVVKATNGKYYMYVSVGNEIWAGVSDYPLGPWENAKNDGTPLINRFRFPGYHMIDAEAFIDDDGQAYLYWGSGLNWVNGHCFAVKLKKDMVTFECEPEDITPPNYFEAPYMLKRNGKYYLMYSEGKAIDYTYKIRYSTGSTPMGPWKEGKKSPILSTSADSSTYGPGHHTVFRENGQDYILYHRLIYPQPKDITVRQLCIDSLNFDAEGNIKRINPGGVATFIKKVK
jgi:beta-xylosidase